MSHNTEVGELLASVRKHFTDINRDPDLNDDDKKRLKEFYLEELIAPKARTRCARAMRVACETSVSLQKTRSPKAVKQTCPWQ